MSYSRRNKKKVRCICHGPIAVSEKYSSPWEDVSIYWHEKRKPKLYIVKEKGNLKFEWDNPHGFVITPV